MSNYHLKIHLKLCAQWIGKDPSFLHADSKDSGQTGRMSRLIWVFAGRTVILMVLSWGGTYEPRHEKTCFMPYANNNDADQPLLFAAA